MDAKLLIADADERSANVLRAILCNQGYCPIVVRSAEQLLHMARHGPLNLIIVDVALPRTDGIELCRSLQEQEETQHIPIIIMTAPEQEEARGVFRENAPSPRMPMVYAPGTRECAKGLS